MPQIKDSFKLRSKVPNFERDVFDTIDSMMGPNFKPNWVDFGHISFCKETNKHYKFVYDHENVNSINNESLSGPKRDDNGLIISFKKDKLGRFGFGYWRELTGQADSKYTSKFSGDLAVLTYKEVGGISKNTKLEDLDGKPVSELFDKMLFPKILPIINQPKVTITVNPLIKNKLFKVGDERPEYLKESSELDKGYFLIKTDYGSVSLNDVLLKNSEGTTNYAGEESDPYRDFECRDDEGNLIAKATVTFNNPGTYKYRGRMHLNKGKLQPVDNQGNDVFDYWQTGWTDFKDSNELIVEVSYPVYANGVECPLIKWINNPGEMHQEFELQATHVGKQIFKTPRKTTKLQMLFCEGYSDTNLSNYTESEEYINNRKYYVYEYTGAERGEVKLKAYF